MNKLYLLLFFATTFGHSQEIFTVYFDFDVDFAKETSADGLNNWLEKSKDVKIIKVHGYADPQGTNSYNKVLSRKRADYVTDILSDSHVSFSKDFKIKAFGEEFELSDNNAKNRKAVIYYTRPNKKLAKFVDAVETAEKGDILRVPSLNFYNNSDIILRESRPVLNKLLKLLKENPDLKIDIQGHICCQIVEKNAISHKRAVAIYKYLIRNGINKNRLSHQSFGSSKPIYELPEKNETERKANRRVEIEIIDN